MVREIALRSRRTGMLALLAIVAITARPAVGLSQSSAEIAPDSVHRAQNSTAAPDTTTLSGPRLTRAGFDHAVVNGSADALPQKPANNVHAGQNLALMGAGGAAVIVGLLIGGDGGHLLALGGGVVGIYGLYRYLR